MRVKSCEASDGTNPPIYLSDENGCVLRPKMVSKFMKLRNNDGRATVLTYAHFHAFKFPDSMSVNLRCKVEICRFGCPDHCQKPTAGNPIGNYNEPPQALQSQDNYGSGSSIRRSFVNEPQPLHQSLASRLTSSSVIDSTNTVRRANNRSESGHYGLKSGTINKQPIVIPNEAAGHKYLKQYNQAEAETIELPRSGDFPYGPRSLRRRRYAVHNRNTRSAELGVTTDYQVISEADLEFTPTKDEAVTVFQGHREDVVYGICLPAPGFSALFVLLAMCTVISVLVAGFMCHHRQIQKDTIESPAAPHPHQTPLNMVHFLRAQLIGHIL